MTGRIAVAAIAVVIGVGLFLYRSSRREEVNAAIDAMPEKIMAVCARTEGFAQFDEFVSEHADQADRDALAASHTPGGRRTAPKFDGRKYAAAFGASLVRQGQRFAPDPQRDLFLRQLQIQLEQAAARGEFD